MTIIRFLLPNNDHTLKKLLLIFWEIVPKTTSDGKLLQEMILVCDAYRKVCSVCLRAYIMTWCAVYFVVRELCSACVCVCEHACTHA